MNTLKELKEIRLTCLNLNKGKLYNQTLQHRKGYRELGREDTD